MVNKIYLKLKKEYKIERERERDRESIQHTFQEEMKTRR